MNKNFGTIKSNIGSDVQDTSTAFATIIGRYINRRYFQVLRSINWENIQPDYTFDTTVGTQRYVLPSDFRKEISCTDTTNDTEISRFSLQELYSTYKDLTTSGTVERYAITEECVQNQPTSASVLAIVSSSASDTTPIVFIRGISGGVEVSESVTVTGTTPVNTTNSYTRIKAISKSAASVGKITITSNSSAVTNAVIAPEELEGRYKIAILHYKPAEVITIAMPYIIQPLPLSNAYDIPVLDMADLIEIGATADAFRYKKQFQKASVMEALFTSHLADYIWDKENNSNGINLFAPEVFDRDNII